MTSIEIKKTALESVIKINSSIYRNDVSKLIEDAEKVESFLNKKATTFNELFSALATIDDIETTEDGRTCFYFDASEKNRLLVDLLNNSDTGIEFKWSGPEETAFTLTFGEMRTIDS